MAFLSPIHSVGRPFTSPHLRHTADGNEETEIPRVFVASLIHHRCHSTFESAAFNVFILLDHNLHIYKDLRQVAFTTGVRSSSVRRRTITARELAVTRLRKEGGRRK